MPKSDTTLYKKTYAYYTSTHNDLIPTHMKHLRTSIHCAQKLFCVRFNDGLHDLSHKSL